MENFAEVIGFVACCISVMPFIPQIIKIYTTNSAKSISMTTYVLFCIGTILWFIYGLLIDSMPIVITNSISFVLEIIIIKMKLNRNHYNHNIFARDK